MSNDNKKISLAVVRRLPRYYRYLYDLLQSGVTRISSRELSEKMGVTASQIRQDLNCFGGFGQQGYGYNVQNLFNEISKILGTDHRFNVIIFGFVNGLKEYGTCQGNPFLICQAGGDFESDFGGVNRMVRTI
jgi:redox-sensing transcriptional repressor